MQQEFGKFFSSCPWFHIISTNPWVSKITTEILIIHNKVKDFIWVFWRQKNHNVSPICEELNIYSFKRICKSTIATRLNCILHESHSNKGECFSWFVKRCSHKSERMTVIYECHIFHYCQDHPCLHIN